jgi:AcrR family transcriptional regulator
MYAARVATPGFQRARSADHKAQRRESILAAAQQLAVRDGVRQVTLSDIAELVGIHKSALLRYFGTREEIFLELTGRAWGGWAASTSAGLSAIAPDDAGAAADAVAATLAASFAARPLLCDLIPHTALNLERHASPEAVHAYKLTSLGAVERVTDGLAAPLPGLVAAQRRELVSAVALLAGAMFQIATPPPVLAELYRSEPALGHALLDLPERLRRATRVMIAGLAALPPP